MPPRRTMEFPTLILILLLIHILVLQDVTNPFLLFHFTSYHTGFYIAARWYFSLNHCTSQRFDRPGHVEKYRRLWFTGINNHRGLHPSMQSNNQQRTWQLPASKRKKNWKHVQTIVNRIWTFPSFSWVIIIKLTFPWVTIIKLTCPWVFLPPLSPLAQPAAAGCLPGHRSTTPWTTSGSKYSSFSKSLAVSCC